MAREPNFLYDLRLLRPHLLRLFNDAKLQYLDLFEARELGYVSVYWYPKANDLLVSFGTKEGLGKYVDAVSARTGRTVTDLEAVDLTATPGKPTETEVVVMGLDHPQVIEPELPDPPAGMAWVDVAALWRVIQLDGSTTEFYQPTDVPEDAAHEYETIDDAASSPVELTDAYPGSFLARGVYEILELADYSDLAGAGRVVVAYNDGYMTGIIEPRYVELGAVSH